MKFRNTIVMMLLLALFSFLLFMYGDAVAGVEMPDMKNPPKGMNVNQNANYNEAYAKNINNIDVNPVNKAYGGSAKAFSNIDNKVNAYGVAPGGTVQGGHGGAGGNGGLGGNGGQGGQSNVNVSGVGNTSFNNPRQTPMAYAPSSYSANPCIMNYSAGGSGAPFGFSLGISAESDDCNRRADSVRWQEMNAAIVACERMLIDSEENQDALKHAGINCSNVASYNLPVQTLAPPPVATPALDDYVTRKELDDKLNNHFKKVMGK